MIVAGTVHVDDNGVETFAPNDATNAAKGLYHLLIAYASGHTHSAVEFGASANPDHEDPMTRHTPTMRMVHRAVPISVLVKRHQAAQANLMAAWTVAVVRAEVGSR